VKFFKSLSKQEIRFAVIAWLAGIAYLILEMINNRAQMADFRVYYDAASALLNNSNMYGEAFGVSSGFYKYSPAASLPFVPFVLLPYSISSCIYYILVLYAIVWFMIVLVREISGENLQRQGLILLLVTLFLADHLERELHLGNVNLFLLIACFAVYRSIIQGKKLLAGIVYAIVLLFKPHFLILLPYWIWRKEWKMIGFAAASVVMGLFLPALLKGWQGNMDLLQQWMAAIRDHNVQLYESPNTVYGLVNVVLPESMNRTWLVPVLLLLTAMLFLTFMLKNKKHPKQERLFIEMFLLVALIPNLVHTDTEHFMWTWPLIAFSIIRLMHRENRYRRTQIVILALTFIPYCLNSPDLVGKQTRYLFDEGGLLGLANLLIIVVGVWLYQQKAQRLR
jgi:hypothetical protein